MQKGADTAIRATAEEVAKDTTADPSKAYAKYGNKTLILKGLVSAIKTDSDNPAVKFIELKGDGKTLVQCMFGASSKESKIRDGYKPGDTANFECELTRADKGLFIVGPCYPVDEKK